MLIRTRAALGASLVAALVLPAATVIVSSADASTRAPVVSRAVGGGASALGLPALSTAARYNLAPASRTVVPQSVRTSTPVNFDYVTASSQASEQDAHDLKAGSTSTTTKQDGTTVRQAGPGVPGAEFSYLLHAPSGRSVTVRIEESGSATSDYAVLVGDRQVWHRAKTDTQYVLGANPVGVVHYDIAVSGGLVRDGAFRITFRNAADPGDGARIASAWAYGDGGRTQAPYGGTTSNPRGAIAGGTTRLSSDIFGRPYVIYDFGREVGGKVLLQVDNTAGAPKLGLAFSESWQFIATTSDFSGDPRGVATETHYFDLPKGASTVDDQVIRGGFRYLMVFLASPGSVTLSDLRLTFTADPTMRDLRDYQGAFLSSDDTLNRLWYSGAYTSQMSTIDPRTGRPYPAQPGPVRNDALVAQGDSFVSDGAKRDRLDWGGDNVVSNPVAYLTTGETEPSKNSIEWFAAHPSPQGQVPGVYLPAPAGFNYGWGEYAGWWTRNYWTHYLYTGDKAFLDKWFGVMQRNVDWFESSVGVDGLWDVPASAGGHWGYGQSGKETYDNTVYVYSLRAAAAAATAEGRPDLAAKYAGFAKRTSDAVNAKLFDAKAGAYVTLPGSAAHPLDANALAVVSGIATGDRATGVLRFIKSTLATEYGDLAVDTTAGNNVTRVISPFLADQEMLANAVVLDDTGALDVLRRTWAHMLTGDSTGTLWETVSPTGGLGLASYTSMSHGWGTGPTKYLTNQLLGVTPTSGGFADFIVLPHPGSVGWAEGRVPTPHGAITTAWKSTGKSLDLQVEAPTATGYTAGVPAKDVKEVRVDGVVVWTAGHATGPQVALRDGYVQIAGRTGTTTVTATYGDPA